MSGHGNVQQWALHQHERIVQVQVQRRLRFISDEKYLHR